MRDWVYLFQRLGENRRVVEEKNTLAKSSLDPQINNFLVRERVVVETFA